MRPKIERLPDPVLCSQPGVDWAETMVLNPAIIKDPETDGIHMLFRATGPYLSKRLPGKPPPFPIFLGYAFSGDGGWTWQADFKCPALAPSLEYARDRIQVFDRNGKEVVNHANGCIEDPRLMFVGETLYLTAACRMFPPGPYWEQDEPMQCAPEWARAGDHDLGRAASQNVTVNVLYEVDLEKLAGGHYEKAFTYVSHLTDPEYGENRDVVLFPEKMEIRRREQLVMLHRPENPSLYPGFAGKNLPSIFISSADEPEQFPASNFKSRLAAAPIFDWETERIGASAPPIRISPVEWLLCYHGKKDAIQGYTQCFMILKDREDSLPVIVHRCSERLMYAQADWEQPGRFPIPCVFVCGAVNYNRELLISYGAADERCGIARVDLNELVSYVKRFGPSGEKL